MNELPDGWAEAPLLDIVELHDRLRVPLNASQRSDRRGPYPYYGANGQVDSIDDYIFDGDYLLVAEDGGHFAEPWRGVAYLASGKFWVNNHAHILTTRGDIPLKYLKYWMNNLDWMPYVSGSTRLKLSQQGMKDIIVPLAPEHEQIRIVRVIDSLFSRIDRAANEYGRVPFLIRRYREEILRRAVNGELTQDWREEAGVTPSSPVTLANVSKTIRYGSSAKSAKSGEIPVLRMGNIQDMFLDWTDLVYTSDAGEIEKYRLEKGDVLFNRTNSAELVGKTALYRGERPAVFAGYIIQIKCDESILPEYLNYCLNSPQGREYCWSVKSDSVSQSNINAKKLAAFSFLLPSLREQKEIVSKIDRALAWARRIEHELAAVEQLRNKLASSILQRAFSGKLATNDPNDESASALLLRIQEENASRTKGQERSVASRVGKQERATKGPKDMGDKKRSDVTDKHLSELLDKLGGAADARDLWQKSEMGLDEFYKLLRDEVKAGRIKEADNKERLVLGDAA